MAPRSVTIFSHMEQVPPTEREARKAEGLKLCKTWACIDRFLLHLGRIDPENLYNDCPTFYEIEEQDRLNAIKKQLVADLDRYAPHLLKDGKLDLDSKELDTAIYSRWTYWKTHSGQPDGFDNVFRRTVGKKHYARLMHAVRTGKDRTVASLQELAFNEACDVLYQSGQYRLGGFQFAFGGTIAIEDQAKVENKPSQDEIPTQKIFENETPEHENRSCQKESCEVRSTANESPEDEQATSDHDSTEDESRGDKASNTDSSKDETFAPRISPRVRIFWTNEKDAVNAQKLELPISDTRGSNQESLQQLVMDCSPVNVNRGNDAMFDSSYRNARKLDIDQFAINFHPADFGILENIEKILLPDITTKLQNRLSFQKLIAKLYKLNAYSAPSGCFPKYADSSTAEELIGWLIVCLPAPFEGGNLIVRDHVGNDVVFDWSRRSASCIQWAAFYLDCEHEIETVTKGHCITLTYHLYTTYPLNIETSHNPIVELQTLPFYEYVRSLTMQPGFMKDGGILGFGCSHGYAHTSEVATELFPSALKGPDRIIYSIFKSFGYPVNVLPILKEYGSYGVTNPLLGFEGGTWRILESKDFVERSRHLANEYFDAVSEDFQDCDDVEKRLKSLCDATDVLLDTCYIAQDIGKEWPSGYRDYKCIAKVGTTLKPYFVLQNKNAWDELEENPNNSYYKFYWGAGITWITDRYYEEKAFTGIDYNSTGTAESVESCVAILVVIPPWEERAKMIDPV